MSPRRKGTGIHSLVWKLFAQVGGCIVAVLVALWLLNTFALKDYYIGQKQQGLQDAFLTANRTADNRAQLRQELLNLRDTDGIDAVVWQGRQLLFSTFDKERFLLPGTIEYKPGTYEMTIAGEDRLMADGNPRDQVILLVGTLQNGAHLYLRAPIAAIEESVAVTNRFLIITGGIALVVGLLSVWVISRRYARPIRQLVKVADGVARLDFTGRYTGRAQDEVGALGDSINAMSRALEDTVTQLKNANVRLLSDIRQKETQDQARRAFIANVSHELKTPIALIGTYAEGLREDIAAGGAQQKDYCAVIEEEAHRISQMLRRMTLLMQLEGGAGQLEIERFDVTELVGNLARRLQDRLDAKEVALTLPPDTPCYVYADPYLMENVLENYLTNAIHHVNHAGRITVSLQPAPEGRVRIAVINTGDPIPTEELPRIWESFYKVDKARTRAYGGNGIGLSVVAAIALAHGMPYGVRNLSDGVEFFVEPEQI
ncbi:MAG: HAMP domain-containing protein [Ruminococcaceae bacterium]|nr:HAMP domain-containing protein [Oscillospiraceae bacterium]